MTDAINQNEMNQDDLTQHDLARLISRISDLESRIEELTTEDNADRIIVPDTPYYEPSSELPDSDNWGIYITNEDGEVEWLEAPEGPAVVVYDGDGVRFEIVPVVYGTVWREGGAMVGGWGRFHT